jgi:hypothetical protein
MAQMTIERFEILREHLVEQSRAPEAIVDAFLALHRPPPPPSADSGDSGNSGNSGKLENPIDLDMVAELLGMQKFNLAKLLRSSYREGVDFVVLRSGVKTSYRKVLMTPQTFRRICMRSLSRQAEEVRGHFLELESLLVRRCCGPA